MPNEYQFALWFLAAGAVVALAGVIVGGFLMFRGSKVAPGTGEGLWRAPKGDAFNIASDGFRELTDKERNPDEEHVLSKTSGFLKAFGRGNNALEV